MSFTSDREDSCWYTDFNLKKLSVGKRLVDRVFGLKEAETTASFLIPEAETLVNKSGVKINHKHSHKFFITYQMYWGLFAMFPKRWDYEIFCPEVQLFQGDEKTKQKYYYYGIFHELTHWSGTANKLNRKPQYPKDKQTSYACEEIVATFGSMFLLDQFGLLDDEMRQRATLYMNSYFPAILHWMLASGDITLVLGNTAYDYIEGDEFQAYIKQLGLLANDAVKYIRNPQK